MAGGVNQIGAENLSVSTAAVALTGVTGMLPRHVLIYVGTSPIRFRADGTDPDATNGMYVAAGSYIDWTNVDNDYLSMMNKVKFIRDTTAGADATLAVAYFD